MGDYMYSDTDVIVMARRDDSDIRIMIVMINDWNEYFFD